jgi:hypothetical protein
VFGLIAPKVFRPIPLEDEVWKRLVIPYDFVPYGIEHSVKPLEKVISDSGGRKRGVRIIGEEEASDCGS